MTASTGLKQAAVHSCTAHTSRVEQLECDTDTHNDQVRMSAAAIMLLLHCHSPRFKMSTPQRCSSCIKEPPRCTCIMQPAAEDNCP